MGGVEIGDGICFHGDVGGVGVEEEELQLAHVAVEADVAHAVAQRGRRPGRQLVAGREGEEAGGGGGHGGRRGRHPVVDHLEESEVLGGAGEAVRGARAAPREVDDREGAAGEELGGGGEAGGGDDHGAGGEGMGRRSNVEGCGGGGGGEVKAFGAYL